MAKKQRPGTGRGNWTYNPDVHIPELLQVFSEGGDIARFCANLKISRTTYYDWAKKFPDFAQAIDEAYELARAWWEDVGRNNLCSPQFNVNAWRLMMRNRFDMTDSRPVNIKGLTNAKTFGAQHRLVGKAIESGDITPEEALKLAQFIGVGAKIEQVDEIKLRLEALEANVVADKT